MAAPRQSRVARPYIPARSTVAGRRRHSRRSARPTRLLLPIRAVDAAWAADEGICRFLVPPLPALRFVVILCYV